MNTSPEGVKRKKRRDYYDRTTGKDREPVTAYISHRIKITLNCYCRKARTTKRDLIEYLLEDFLRRNGYSIW